VFCSFWSKCPDVIFIWVTITFFHEVEVEVHLRPTVSRPVCPGVKRPSGTSDQFLFLLEISFRQLRLCYCVAPSLTWGLICNLLVQLLPGLARAVTLGSNPAELTAIFYCLIWDSLIWDSPNLEDQVSLFIFPRNRVAQLYTRALGYHHLIHLSSLCIALDRTTYKTQFLTVPSSSLTYW
jgi:hypothetical protein